MVHIYTGAGKGKTTAAMGLAIRAAGCGRRVMIAQFFKGRDSGELRSLERLGVRVVRLTKDYGFFRSMSQSDRELVRAEHDGLLRCVTEDACEYGLILLDECISAYNLNALDREALTRLIRGVDGGTELILTGRDAPEELLSLADYVTEMVKVKHPYDKGVPAREGIEY